MRLLKAIAIYLNTQYSWAAAWRLAGDQPARIDAPVRTVKGEDGLDYVEIPVRFVP